MRTTRQIIGDTLVIQVQYYAGKQFGWMTAKTHVFSKAEIEAALASRDAR